jgi:predicted AAA+ superfamily ATPase
MKRVDLERFNEWWFTRKVRRELAPEFKRYGLAKVMGSLNERQILIITGLRRVGKTTLFYQTIERLLESVEPERVLYFPFDESLADPKEVLEVYEREVLSKPFEEAGGVFVFLDEIQYAKNWPSVIKRFYDLYPNVKFFISGSSSLLLSREALEKLSGRFFFFELKPLTFFEFLEMKGEKFEEGRISSRRFEILFSDYLKRAGFPEIVDLREDRIGEYVRGSIIDRVIFRDLPALFRTREAILVEKLIRYILSNPGSIINTNSLAGDLGTNRITLSNYLKMLETSLILRALSNFRPSFLSSSRKLRRYYPATTSLIYSISKETFERNFGKVLETYVVNALNAELYFRDKGKEVDAILQKDETIVPIEVKEAISEGDVKRFLRIAQSLNSKKAILLGVAEGVRRGIVSIYPVYMAEKLLGEI